jgi:hypothetical protein
LFGQLACRNARYAAKSRVRSVAPAIEKRTVGDLTQRASPKIDENLQRADLSPA